MVWVEFKSVGFGCPYFADVFEGREAFEGLQPPPIIVGVDEVIQVRSQLRVAVIMAAFDGGLLDRPVHPFGLPVGRGMLDLGQPMLDLVFVAAHVEHVRRVKPSCHRQRLRRAVRPIANCLGL